MQRRQLRCRNVRRVEHKHVHLPHTQRGIYIRVDGPQEHPLRDTRLSLGNDCTYGRRTGIPTQKVRISGLPNIAQALAARNARTIPDPEPTSTTSGERVRGPEGVQGATQRQFRSRVGNMIWSRVLVLALSHRHVVRL